MVSEIASSVWDTLLTLGVGVLGWMFKHKTDELTRIGLLLNQTREEGARDYVTRAEVNQTVDRLADRIDRNFERLEGKIDRAFGVKDK